MLRSRFPKVGLDVAIASALAICAACASWAGVGLTMGAVDYGINDLWFQSDLPRVVDNMYQRAVWYPYSGEYHPLFPLVMYPPTGLFRLAGLSGDHAIAATVASTASLWVVVFYGLLRLIGCRRLDAVVFTLMAGTSAAAIFWFSVPETFGLGSLTLLIALILAVVGDRRRLGDGAYVALNVLTLSGTITNWMAGILVTAVARPFVRVAYIGIAALASLAMLWGAQGLIFSEARFHPASFISTRYVWRSESGGPLTVGAAFAFHSLVMPQIAIGPSPDSADPTRRMLATQTSSPGSGSPWGVATLAGWTLLMAVGVRGLFSVEVTRGFRIVLGTTVLGQLLLHLIFGTETFLYSLHFIPLLVVVAALGTLTRLRPLVMVAAVLVTVGAATNNIHQFKTAVAMAAALNPPCTAADGVPGTRRGPWSLRCVPLPS